MQPSCRARCADNTGKANAALVPPRRFPPPWSVEETDACFIVRDHNSQALAYIYFEDEPRADQLPLS